MKRIVLGLCLFVAVGALTFGQQTFLRIAGTLSPSDSSLPSGGYVDRYDVRVPEGTIVAALAVAVDYLPELEIDLGSGPKSATEGVIGSAYVTGYASQAATMRVAVSAPQGARGDYMLRVYQLPLVGRIGAGQTIEGDLTADDSRTADDRYIDWYSLSLDAGQSVSLIASAGFDSYMIVEYPDGGRVENDDTNGTDAGAFITAGDSATYLVGVTSLSAETTGSYALVAEALSPPERISIGEVVLGRLDAGEIMDRYAVRGEEGDVVIIGLDSEDFDTYLVVDDDSGNRYENDDAPGGSTNSQLTYAFVKSGLATIQVKSFHDSSPGSYRLSIADAGDEYSLQEVEDGQLLESGRPVTAMITDDSAMVGGRVGQRFTFRARESQAVTAFVESDSFDAYLEIRFPSGEVLTDDDTRGNSDAELSFLAEEAGVYELFATSYGGSSVGVYSAGVDLGSIARVLVREEGALSNGDGTDAEGRYFDEVDVFLSPRQSVSVLVESIDFDTYLYVYGPDGSVVVEDDDGGQNGNSRADFVPTTSGTYTIRVTSYSQGSIGDYDLLVAEETR